MHQASAFKLKLYRLWCTILNSLQSRGPLFRTRFIPMAKHKSESTFISLWTIQEYPRGFLRTTRIRGIPSFHCTLIVKTWGCKFSSNRARNRSISYELVWTGHCNMIWMYLSHLFPLSHGAGSILLRKGRGQALTA